MLNEGGGAQALTYSICLILQTCFDLLLWWLRVSLVAQLVKNLPAMRETWVRSLGQEDPLEKEMTTHSRMLAWEISWTEKPGGL